MPACSLGESRGFIFSARVQLLRRWVCRKPPPPGGKFASLGKLLAAATQFTLRCSACHLAFMARSIHRAKRSSYPTASHLPCLPRQRIRPPASASGRGLAGGQRIGQQAPALSSPSWRAPNGRKSIEKRMEKRRRVNEGESTKASQRRRVNEGESTKASQRRRAAKTSRVTEDCKSGDSSRGFV